MNSTPWPHLLLVAAFLACSEAGAVPTHVSFDRYNAILERKPFGELAAPENPAANVPQAESFAKSLRLCTIIERDEGGIRVGFIDTRNNKSYMLSPGESEDGIELVSASFQDEEAILRQGAEMALIKLQSGEVRAITEAEQQKREADTQQNQNRPSYAERRRMRQQQVAEEQHKQEEPPPKPKYTGDELAKHLYEYQMEVIRQGLPPLPIPLTPEQDAQLVKEGVLPP